MTFTENVHELFAGSVAPDRLIALLPCTAAIVPPSVAQLPPTNPLGVETTSPAGSVSLNATPVSGIVLALGFVRVKVKLVVPLSGIVAAPNALLIEGALKTVTLADAVLPGPPFVDVTAPVVLFCGPAVVPVTFTENVHELFAA